MANLNNKILKAQMWDKMQFLFRNYYDRMVHVVLHYDGFIDMEALISAYDYMVKKVPILHSSFVNNPIKPFWKVNTKYNINEFIGFVETDNRDKAVNDFMTQEISVKAACQFRALIIRSKGKDTLCQLMNHMCMDGGDSKQLLKNLVEAYNLRVSRKIIDVKVKDGDRSHYQVYTKFNAEDKETALGLYKNVSQVKDKTKFPFTPDNTNTSRIIRSIINKDTFLAMKAKGKTMGASVNDIILASYMRALYKVCEVLPQERLSVPCMVDLRRHIEGDNSLGFSNQVGFMICSLDKFDENITDTILKVKESSLNAKKDKYLGLYSLPLLNLAYKVFPQAIAEIAIRIGYTNPFTGMSNIGIINENELTLSGLKLEYAWMTGAIKKKPYMQLALATYKDEITMSIAVKCNDEDEKIINKFLQIIKGEIMGFLDCK